jgi:hypothetical protein
MNIITILAATAAMLSVSATAAQTPPAYQETMATAGKAFQESDWPALNDALDAAQAARPYSLYVYRNRILARMLAGREDEALALAGDAADRGLSLDLTGHPAFDRLAALPEFAPLAARMQENAAPLGAPAATREFAETALLPEALAYGKKQALYVGSVRSGAIMTANRNDKTMALVAQAPGGVFDLEVRGRAIWAAVNNQLAYDNADPVEPFAAVMAFDVKTGAVLHDIRVSEEAALLGDLEIAKDGTVYASDSITPRLYRMTPGGKALEVFAENPRFVNLQGIALDEKNNRLFIADYLSGLFAVDTATGAVTEIANGAGAHLGGIDGLYYYKGDLVGIQNGTTPQRIVWIRLNDDATAATAFIAMHGNLDGWNEPTHGAIVGNELRYIATSHWPAYDDNGSLREGAAPQPLRIMTLPLESR